MLYETFEGFTYSFVDKNDPKLWSGDRNWTAPIDADDELVITKISSPRVAKSGELKDFNTIANTDDDAKS